MDLCVVHYVELNSNNILMKMQVYELLSALTIYSSEGYQVANTALLHYKVVNNNYVTGYPCYLNRNLRENVTSLVY